MNRNPYEYPQPAPCQEMLSELELGNDFQTKFSCDLDQKQYGTSTAQGQDLQCFLFQGQTVSDLGHGNETPGQTDGLTDNR